MELLQQIHKAGVVGCTSGVPTDFKLKQGIDYLIINALESDPFSSKDNYIINQYFEEIVIAVEYISRQINIKHKIMALRKDNFKEIQMFADIIKQKQSSMIVHALNDFYPSSDEKILIFEITGKIIPMDRTSIDMKTVVLNVETIFNIYMAMKGHVVTHKYITVAGEISNPCVLKVPLGVSFNECINYCGKLTTLEYDIFSGGLIGGDLFSKEDLRYLIVAKTTESIVIVDKNKPISSDFLKTTNEYINEAKKYCQNCNLCTKLCPKSQIGYGIKPHEIMKHISSCGDFRDINNEEILNQAFFCCECGICQFVACRNGLSPKRINMVIKNMLKDYNLKYGIVNEGYGDSKLIDHTKISVEDMLKYTDTSDYMVRNVKKYGRLKTSKITIPLKQHIGIAPSPIVCVGEMVEMGQLIANCDYGIVGCNMHSSINGIVTNIDDNITIEKI